MKAALISAAVLFAMAAWPGPSLRAQGPASPAEQTLLQSTNRERAARGIPPLRWSAKLADAARQHALRMARQNTLSHQLPGEPGLESRVRQVGVVFSSLAENVAEGPSPGEIQQAFINSPPHRANLLDRELDSVGIAVVARGDVLFAVEDFSLEGGKLSLREQEEKVSKQLQSLGLRLLTHSNDARRSCVLDNGYVGSRVPSFVLHYATTDLQGLPGILEQRIHSGRYHSAMVGACANSGKSGLAGYRIAILLYE
ncbi:MAG TPA: CAP domain-containing protein [Candidatus Dormibacteraeota bacterium]|nr:CAP domain-containing protein [Candidatus Dormibacteraeota bacterium]